MSRDVTKPEERGHLIAALQREKKDAEDEERFVVLYGDDADACIAALELLAIRDARIRELEHRLTRSEVIPQDSGLTTTPFPEPKVDLSSDEHGLHRRY